MLSNLKYRSIASNILIVLGAIALLVIGSHLLLQYLNLEIFYQQNGFVYELSNRFDLDDESSVPTWFSQVLFLMISLAAALAAYLSSKSAVRKLWQAIAFIGIVLSIDEIATLHEFVLQSLHNIFFRDALPTSTNNAWLLITPLLLVAVIWSIWKITKLLPKKTVTFFTLAIFVLLFGAVFIDMIASVADRETFMNQGILIAIEESLEMIANIIVIYAITDYLETVHGTRIKSAVKHLK